MELSKKERERIQAQVVKQIPRPKLKPKEQLGLMKTALLGGNREFRRGAKKRKKDGLSY